MVIVILSVIVIFIIIILALCTWGNQRIKNIPRVNNIEGHCNNIHQGKVRVGFSLTNCAGFSGSYDAYTGYNTVSRIFIEEVPKSQT